MARIADPRPALCSACGNSGDPDTEYVDFEAAWDGPVVLNDDGSYRSAPNGEPSASENIYLCKACVRAGAQLLEIKPELHRNQLREIRRLEIENQHLRDRLRSVGRELERTRELQLGPEPPRARRVAA